MRRLFVLLILFMVAGAGLFAQTVTLTFTGRGSGGLVADEIYQQIDSLQVRNITREWEQMIYYPDTVVVMEPLAVPMFDVRRSGLEQNVPNPFDCVTEADLTLPEEDVVALAVVGANGREYASFKQKLGAGTHKFEITLSVPQAYLLTATTSTSKYSVKMVNLGSCGTDRIVLKSSSDYEISAKGVISNEFYRGDQMEYLAFTTYNGIVFDASELRTSQEDSEDITIHFNIPYCSYYLGVDTRYGCEYVNVDGMIYFESLQAATTLRLTSSGGCDSIIVVDVVVDHPVEIVENITACQPITWNGQNCVTTDQYIVDLISQGGCDSTVVLNFRRADNILHHWYDSDCESISWNGETYDETGEYVQHFQTQYGCDSIVTLHFTKLSNDTIFTQYACDEFTWFLNGRTYNESNNTDTVHLINQNGCDSIVRLNLVLNRTGYNRIDRMSCGEFVYNGHTYYNSGTYVDTLTIPRTGCDSIVELHLVIIHDTITEIYESACDSFEFDGHTYTQSGVYDIHYHPNTYCDSIVRLHLTVGRTAYSEQEVEACDSYTWFDEVYTESGDYTHTIPYGNSEHCDSVITLHLTIKHSVTSEETIDACRAFDLNGESITESDVYYGTYTAANGCDSTVTYYVNIFDDVSNEFTVLACGSFTWNNRTYTESGDFEQHFQTFVGCDSAVTLHLFIGEPHYGIDDYQTACDSYEWEGDTYTASGNYTKTLENIYHCDSVVTLHLIVNPSYNLTDSHTDCDSYEWEGDTYTESGIYSKTLRSVTDCDSVVTLNLTINYSVQHEIYDTCWGPTDMSDGSVYNLFRAQYLNNRLDTLGPKIWNDSIYTRTGDYQQKFTATNGCDSTVTLHLVYHELAYDIRDGKTYRALEYGDQVWMIENMKYLPQVNTDKNNAVAKYYVYGYSGTILNEAKGNSNYKIYGTMYNWTAAQTACPTGWHLPSEDEWSTLIGYLNDNGYSCNPGGTTGNMSVAKSMASQTNWTQDNTNECTVGHELSTNNSSGFNALPGGYLNVSGNTLNTTNFTQIQKESNWWSATGTENDNAYRYRIIYNSSNIERTAFKRHRGYYVRCLKDNN